MVRILLSIVQFFVVFYLIAYLCRFLDHYTWYVIPTIMFYLFIFCVSFISTCSVIGKELKRIEDEERKKHREEFMQQQRDLGN